MVYRTLTNYVWLQHAEIKRIRNQVSCMWTRNLSVQVKVSIVWHCRCRRINGSIECKCEANIETIWFHLPDSSSCDIVVEQAAVVGPIHRPKQHWNESNDAVELNRRVGLIKCIVQRLRKLVYNNDFRLCLSDALKNFHTSGIRLWCRSTNEVIVKRNKDIVRWTNSWTVVATLTTAATSVGPGRSNSQPFYRLLTDKLCCPVQHPK